MEYKPEIWEWKEIEDLEKIMFDYVRWIFGLELCTIHNYKRAGDRIKLNRERKVN